MKLLFVHQNFPGQFRHLSPALAAAGHEVRALGIHANGPGLPGVVHHRYSVDGQAAAVNAAWMPMREWQTKVVRGRTVAAVADAWAGQGWTPDVVFAHSGWGESLFLRDVLPRARQLVYAEYYYGTAGGDAGFDPEFGVETVDERIRSRMKNTHLLHALAASDGALSPTEFQRSLHPAGLRERIEVVHDGIDTRQFVPDPEAAWTLPGKQIVFRPGDEVITFVARQLEPYRGYHVFMRALPSLLARRPGLQVVIVGGDGVSYGAAPPAGTTWKQVFLDEQAGRLDLSRVHFVGRLAHQELTRLFQVTAAHVYLTYPFVLSWSLLEAMSIGCLIVGSRTAPVQEVIEHGRNGLLVDFFDVEALAATVADTLERRQRLTALREAARRDAVDRFDLLDRCLPAQMAFTLGQR
jgi:glycosyltransferase involved in cell wall biosynthesis